MLCCEFWVEVVGIGSEDGFRAVHAYAGYLPTQTCTVFESRFQAFLFGFDAIQVVDAPEQNRVVRDGRCRPTLFSQAVRG